MAPATAPITDALVRLGLPVRTAALQAVQPAHIAGRALPCRHAGSVDIFLESFLQAKPGDVLVIDNQGRDDEGCIGDLTALEAKAHGLVGIVVDGRHRDEALLRRIGLPVWSRGRIPNGPLAARERAPDALGHATIAGHAVTRDDHIVADADGVVIVPSDRYTEVLQVAADIEVTERRQASDVEAGTTLTEQLDVAGYLKARRKDGSLTFREHLRRRGGAIEE